MFCRSSRLNIIEYMNYASVNMKIDKCCFFGPPL
jgi:hypothetical protein